VTTWAIYHTTFLTLPLLTLLFAGGMWDRLRLTASCVARRQFTPTYHTHCAAVHTPRTTCTLRFGADC